MKKETPERRKERRYQVKLRGELRAGGNAVAVEITELSASGVLLAMEQPPAVGQAAQLLIKGFGTLDLTVVHSAPGVSGLVLSRPAEQRDKLMEWLRQEDASREI
jgi:hypothetical protein